MVKSPKPKNPKRPSEKVRKTAEEDRGHDSDMDMDMDMKDSASKSNSGSSKKQKQELSARELRVQRREQESARKSQQTGLGISKENAPKGKKIIFGDVEESLQKETTPANDEKDGEQDMDEEQVQEEEGDDDDDDAVEEMDTAVARETVREQRGKERATARAATVLVKPRRNKRKKQAEVEAADNEFDDDFFAQLDEETTEEQKQEKERKLAQPKGRHTTFVVPDEDATANVPAGHNIEVAVLGEPFDHVILNTKQTETALSFSRNRLDNGSDGVSAKQLQKQKQTGKKTAETPSWQRSKKMNRLVLSGVRSQRRKGQGKAAAHFVVKA